MQSNLRFEQHITTKIKSASKVLGCIKYSLHEAPEKGKLLAYTSLCRPILEYADTLWDLSDNTSRDAIEHVQSQAVRFIKTSKADAESQRLAPNSSSNHSKKEENHTDYPC